MVNKTDQKTINLAPIVNVENLSASITVSNLEESIKWYKENLGFHVFKQKDFEELSARVVYLKVNNVRIELVEDKNFIPNTRENPPGHTAMQGISQLTFWVHDIDTIIERAKSRSIEFAMDAVIAEDLGIKVFFIRDNEGNLIEFIEPITFEKKSDLNSQLIEAVQNNDVDKVSNLLQKGANSNIRDANSGLTVLMMAAGQANDKMVKILLDAGADQLDVDSRAGASVLHKACQGGSVEVVRLLVEAGAFVDSVAPTTGHTPLMDALWFKWPDIVEYLLEKGAGLNLSTHYGFTLSQHFEYELNVNIIGRDRLLRAEKMLNDRRASDQQVIDSQEIMAAVNNDDISTVRQLIQSGVNIEQRYPMVNTFNDAHTPLLVAARDGHTEIVQELLQAGANVNVTEPIFGAVPLHKSVYNGHADITQMLVDQPGIDLDYQGATNGYTPLHDALWHGYTDCSEILINAGARLDLRGHDGKTPLDIATEVFGADHEIINLIKSKLDSV